VCWAMFVLLHMFVSVLLVIFQYVRIDFDAKKTMDFLAPHLRQRDQDGENAIDVITRS